MGLGAKDSFPEAQDFVRRHGTTSFPMLWDPTFASWRHLGVTGQPTYVLYDGDGQPVERWIGRYDEARVLDVARRA